MAINEVFKPAQLADETIGDLLDFEALMRNRSMRSCQIHSKPSRLNTGRILRTNLSAPEFNRAIEFLNSGPCEIVAENRICTHGCGFNISVNFEDYYAILYINTIFSDKNDEYKRYDYAYAQIYLRKSANTAPINRAIGADISFAHL